MTSRFVTVLWRVDAQDNGEADNIAETLVDCLRREQEENGLGTGLVPRQYTTTLGVILSKRKNEAITLLNTTISMDRRR